MPKENERKEDAKTRQRSGGHEEDRNSSDESTAPTPRRMHRNMAVSGSPAMRPGISYSVEDIRGRWSYMVNEGSPHIRRGYRVGLSFSQCLKSMFQLHNETINVWSHLVGAMLFVWLILHVKDSPAFARPRAIVQSVVRSMEFPSFRTNFSASIFEQEFCGSDDEGLLSYSASMHADWSVCAAEGGHCYCPDGMVRYGADGIYAPIKEVITSIGCNSNVFGDHVFVIPKICECNPGGDATALNRTKTCKQKNEQMAFSSARRQFEAAKKLLQHIEFKLPGLERWRELLQDNSNMVSSVRVGVEVKNQVQQKLDATMRNLEESLDSIRAELALLGTASMEGCILCWIKLIDRLAGVRAALQEQMHSINKVTRGLEGTADHNEADHTWGLSPGEWADYTLSEVASVSTALNNGISASKRALSQAAGRLHHELLQDVYSQIADLRVGHVFHDIFPDGLLEHMSRGRGGLNNTGGGDDSVLLMEKWPIVVFLGSAVTCLSTSASYHLFNCHSQKISDALLLLDYAGISVLICGSFFPPIFYGFYCDAGLRDLYLSLILLLSVFSSLVGIYSGLFPSERLRFVRTIAYSANALFAVFPCGHLAVRYLLGGQCWVASLLYIAAMLALYALGSVIYFYQFPERYWPGKFDLLCSSHQLWHIIVFSAAFLHYFCAVGHFHWRSENTCLKQGDFKM